MLATLSHKVLVQFFILKILFPKYAKEIEDSEENHQRNEMQSGKYSRDHIETRGTNDLDHQSRVRKYCYFVKVNIPHALILDTNTGRSQSYTRDEYKELIEDEKYQDFIDQGIITEQVIYKTRVRDCFI